MPANFVTTIAFLMAFAQAGPAMRATKPSDLETVLTHTFAAPRELVFEALTQPTHVLRWLTPANMSLVACEIDLRAGGSYRYVFQRSNGAKLEVRGAYKAVEPPHRIEYVETYDFSPLKIAVTTTLDDVDGGTAFKQTMLYSSKQERDNDFDGVASGAAEVYTNLERLLGSAKHDPPS